MSTLLRSTLTAIATAGALLSASVFAAPATDTAAPTVVTTRAALPDRAGWMSLKQVTEALEKAGYKDTDIRGIHTTKDGYLVSLFNAKDQKGRLMVNPTDGTITEYEKRKGERDHKGDGRKSHKGKRDHCDK